MSKTETLAGQAMTRDGATQPNGILRYLMRFDDGEVIRWSFRGLLMGAIVVIGLDVKALYDEQSASASMTVEPVYLEPALPPVLRPAGPESSRPDPRETVTLDADQLRSPLSFELGAGGVMTITGSIDPGSAQRFATELEQRGEYVKIVSLNSPGGSLDDAMAMAKLVRERGLSTNVPEGALCASSCPLVMAGGVTRTASEKSAVGLHQFYAATQMPTAPAQAMSDAQATTARISRHLAEMDVDPALWLHALDTPPQALYYLTPAEMQGYRLTTGSAVAAIR